MATDKYNRPIITLQSYAKTPQYVKHTADDDRLAILVCRIKIWQAEAPNWFNIPDDSQCLVIREVESIEINNSYKELLSKAVLKFPRGTVVEKRVKSNQAVAEDSGNSDDKVKAQDIRTVTQNGDLLTYGTQAIEFIKNSQEEVKPTGNIMSLDGSQVDVGLTKMNQHLNEKDLLCNADFAIGNRIEIYLGYAYSDVEFNDMQADTSKVPNNMEMVFTGFITSCSVATPLEVECTNMAHVLTTINVADITEKNTMTIKDFLGDDGKYHLLKDTGISLSADIGDCKIEVGKFQISSQLTVADVLDNWNDSGIVSFMENNEDGTSTLRVGKVYYAGFSGDMTTKDKNYITYKSTSTYNILQCDWDVAEDNLTLVNADKKYLAVRATGREKDGREIHFTVRKTDASSESWMADEDDDETWTVVNDKQTVTKVKQKKDGGTRTTKSSKTKNKVDMSNYTVIPYISSTMPTTREKLMEEAKQYWNKYVPNGLSGTLTIFGDRYIRPTDIIGLIDPRQPQKNGYYLVEEVNIKFGVDGYRKELKLPYKIGNFDKYPTYQI